MKRIFRRFSSTGILIVGDVMIDQFIWGNVERISPEAPVPVVEVRKETLLLGGAANVAHNVAALGGKVFLSGTAGNDESGSILRGILRSSGIPADGIFAEGNRPTTVKTRIYAHDQQVVRYDREVRTEIGRNTQSRIVEYVRSNLSRIRAVIISDYCKGVITRSLIRRIIRTAGRKIFIAADPKIGHFDYYKGVSIITPNIQEASSGSGIRITGDMTLKKAGRLLMRNVRSKAVLVTRGDKGMTLFEKNGKITHLPTSAKEVYDVTGAGDTVIAALTLSHAAGMDLKEAAEFANRAAGIVVGERGTAVVTLEEMQKAYAAVTPFV